ncbi:MAG: ATPase domain-containing protein [Cyanobacteria bacterium P01_A01_bin.116]
MRQYEANKRISTGLETLDEILHGGLPAGELYTVNGTPGTGKTTLALHCLQAGASKGEKVLCLALAQRVESLKHTCQSVGIDTSNITFFDLSTAEAIQAATERQTIFDTSEIELVDLMDVVMAKIDAEQPSRLVFDGVAQLRMLANDLLTYRQKLFKLRDYTVDKGITTILTDSPDVTSGEQELQAIANGVITLSLETTEHGSDHRYLRLSKMRGSSFEPGMHDFEITDEGIQLYRSHRHSEGRKLANVDSLKIGDVQRFSSGLSTLDKLVGGGLNAGTTCLMLGPSGTGKTSIATLFARQFTEEGGKASIFLFDESIETFLRRSKGLGMDLSDAIKGDRLRIHELSFGNITPGKFSTLIDRDVEKWGAKIVAIDTLTGYLNAMPTKARLISQMHEIMKRLSQRGILTFLMVAQHGAIGLRMDTAVDISYLADTVLLFRHFEAKGEIRHALSVYKNRYGMHEKQICEIKLQPGSILIDEALGQFSGILSGLPRYITDANSPQDSAN